MAELFLFFLSIPVFYVLARCRVVPWLGFVFSSWWSFFRCPATDRFIPPLAPSMLISHFPFLPSFLPVSNPKSNKHPLPQHPQTLSTNHLSLPQRAPVGTGLRMEPGADGRHRPRGAAALAVHEVETGDGVAAEGGVGRLAGGAGHVLADVFAEEGLCRCFGCGWVIEMIEGPCLNRRKRTTTAYR